ncbi:MAG: DEAD/DEAH box helicase [Planctomycetes bacterium]|nr:DEAD/DEAH box helicase [Planctomycetota bacterium]
MTEPTFEDFALHAAVLSCIRAMGFVRPTPIQQLAIPLILEGKDVIGQAETGTGKTLAFCAPMIGTIDPQRVAAQAVVLCPTRELAQQVEQVAATLGSEMGVKTALVVGGMHASTQMLRLRTGAQVVVGTPGRILDFLREGSLSFGWVSHLVLDEADRMLDMGFIDEVEEIIARVSHDRQTMLFSATVPPRLEKLTHRFMRDPVSISTVSKMAAAPEIRQRFIRLHSGDKEGFILDLLDRYPLDTCIVFCNTRREVIDLDRTLWGLGYSAGSLHGEHEQEKRFKILEAFKARKLFTLVATDVAGRGLDIEKVTRVVNFDVPEEVETYVHRIGRTGRAGGSGESITLVTDREWMEWERVMREVGFAIDEIQDWTPTRPRRRIRDDERRRAGRGGAARGARGGERRGVRRADTRRSGVHGARKHSQPERGARSHLGARREESHVHERRRSAGARVGKLPRHDAGSGGADLPSSSGRRRGRRRRRRTGPS